MRIALWTIRVPPTGLMCESTSIYDSTVSCTSRSCRLTVTVFLHRHNFDDPDRPKALRLPCGSGQSVRTVLNELIEDIKIAIPQALESQEHSAQLQEAEKEVFREHQERMEAFAEKLNEIDLMIIITPAGPKLAGPRNKSQEELPPEKIAALKASIEELQPTFDELQQEYLQLKKKSVEVTQQLNKEAARNAIEYLFEPLKKMYKDLPGLLAHLDAVKDNVIERSQDIEAENKSTDEEFNIMNLMNRKKPVLYDLFKINLIVNNNETMAEGAPVVYEDYPLYQNLIGKVEYTSSLGAFTTDFSLIKGGSLHRANGGYLVVHARDVLMQPYAWEALKRSLRLRHIKIESLGETYGLISTSSLRPEPIDLNVKVVLLGDRLLYYMLQEYDPDFDELFKVAADFNDEMDRSPEACQLFARILGSISKEKDLRPMDPQAIAAMIEQAARHAGDQEKLSTHVRTFTDLVGESNYWAEADGADVIGVEHVRKAIDQHIYRHDRIRELIQDEIRRGTILVDVRGSRIGQVNGLSVMSVGKLAFGRPSRITATARLGKGKVVDIEREVELGGATHSKGVLILSSVLSSRYALDCPLCLSATLVFEQSYGMIDGDSASMAELCALLSVLSNTPIKQEWAITGSVNQFGEAQPIGGATEKIEGFFDVCKSVGLTGDQGVLIPASNVKHLMLRPDVIEAVEAGKFKVQAYNNVDEAIALLTGSKAGERGEDGSYPADSVNFLVDQRLREMADTLRKFSADDSGGSSK